MSRKRKKSRSSKRPNRPAAGQRTSTPLFSPAEKNAVARLLDDRARLEQRREAASAEAARALLAELAGWAPGRTDADVEDELCRRIGARLREWDDAPVEADHVTPYQFGVDLVPAAAEAVGAAVSAGADGWREPWRVLAALARVVPESADGFPELVRDLRRAPGGKALPPAIDQPTVRGEVLWTHDVYGSRFGITAAFGTPGGPDRWYLWDIDACGFKPFLVHAGFYPSQAEALAAWLAGVGNVAAPGSAFTPVDDYWLLHGLLPAEEGFLRSDGESADQLPEYHRSKRLAEAALDAVPAGTPPPARQERQERQERATATGAEFADWLRTRRDDLPEPDELAAQTEELASSWAFDSPPELYHTCSPHRVALTVAHLRNYYQDDFAADLVGLLPDWVAWLATRTGAAPELVERCQPYALGESHPDVGDDDTRVDYFARVTE